MYEAYKGYTMIRVKDNHAHVDLFAGEDQGNKTLASLSGKTDDFARMLIESEASFKGMGFLDTGEGGDLIETEILVKRVNDSFHICSEFYKERLCNFEVTAPSLFRAMSGALGEVLITIRPID